MGWTFKNPLQSLTDDEQNEAAKKLWEAENLGGITEDNNRLPKPVVGLLVLTIITAFLVTLPLWGQRPTAAIYEQYIQLLDKPEVKNAPNDVVAMQWIIDNAKVINAKYEEELRRHPVTLDDLKLIQPEVNSLIELREASLKGDKKLVERLEAKLKESGNLMPEGLVILDEYTVLGHRLTIANFEGEKRADGSTKRVQPWWDKGYTIDVFYILMFCITVIIVVKRLPPVKWQPTHYH